MRVFLFLIVLAGLSGCNEDTASPEKGVWERLVLQVETARPDSDEWYPSKVKQLNIAQSENGTVETAYINVELLWPDRKVNLICDNERLIEFTIPQNATSPYPEDTTICFGKKYRLKVVDARNAKYPPVVSVKDLMKAQED